NGPRRRPAAHRAHANHARAARPIISPYGRASYEYRYAAVNSGTHIAASASVAFVRSRTIEKVAIAIIQKPAIAGRRTAIGPYPAACRTARVANPFSGGAKSTPSRSADQCAEIEGRRARSTV